MDVHHERACLIRCVVQCCAASNRLTVVKVCSALNQAIHRVEMVAMHSVHQWSAAKLIHNINVPFLLGQQAASTVCIADGSCTVE